MKHARKTALAASAFTCAALLSFGWSEQGGISLSIESAQARVGRPLTPVSVAGVARRHNRRAVYGAGGTVGMGPYGGGPNNRGGLVGGDDPGTYAGAAAVGTAAAVAAARGPYYQRAGYYAGGPYYGGNVRDARAAYYGGPSAAWGGVSSSDRDLYFRNLRDSGYNLKNNRNSFGNVATQ
jgi:hypothetical protein